MPIERLCHSFPWSEKVMLSCFSERYINIQLKREEQTVGFYVAEFVAADMTLMDICVAPVFQGKGYGKILINHLIDLSREKHAESIFLEVRESNTSAIALYETVGFQKIDLRKNYYPTADGKEGAIVMKMELSN